jgi:hypothetical protein
LRKIKDYLGKAAYGGKRGDFGGNEEDLEGFGLVRGSFGARRMFGSHWVEV